MTTANTSKAALGTMLADAFGVPIGVGDGPPIIDVPGFGFGVLPAIVGVGGGSGMGVGAAVAHVLQQRARRS